LTGCFGGWAWHLKLMRAKQGLRHEALDWGEVRELSEKALKFEQM
jgi:hypothetical protein